MGAYATMKTNQTRKIVGWREWVAFPDFAVERMKVKVDSGARTSALHAENIEIIGRGRRAKVHFDLFPKQGSKVGAKRVVAPYLGQRMVRSSVGHETLRPVIRTTLQIDSEHWPIEVTLVNRDIMGFRMLLGRTALRHGFLIDPASSYLHSKKQRKK